MLKKGNPVAGIMFIVLISIFAIFLLIVGYIGNTLGTELKDKIGISEEINKSLQTTSTVSTVTLNTLWYVFFACLLLGLIVQAMLAQEYPKVMVPIFILTLIITVIISIALSNAYTAIADNTNLASMSAYQYGIHFVMDNLPYLAVITGLIAIAIIFTRGQGIGSTGGIVN